LLEIQIIESAWKMAETIYIPFVICSHRVLEVSEFALP